MSDPTHPPAATAGEQSHENPWQFAGADADPPQDCGQPVDDSDDSDGRRVDEAAR